MYKVVICIILIIALCTSCVFATPTGNYNLYTNSGGHTGVTGYTGSGNDIWSNLSYNLAYTYRTLELGFNNITTTLDYYLPAINNNLSSVLTRLVDAFSPSAGDTRSIWTLLSQISSNTTATSSALNTTNSTLNNISGYVDGIESQLSSINSNIQFLESINWYDYNNFTVEYSTDNINYSTLPSSNITSKDHYFKIHNNNILDSQLVYITFPVGVYGTDTYYNKFDLNVTYNYSTLTFPIDHEFYFYNNYYYVSFYIEPFYLATTNYYFHISSSELLRYNSSFNVSFKYLKNSQFDYYNIASYLELKQINNNSDNLSDIKNILTNIDNNSDFIINDNDISINVDLDASVGTGVTGVINKLKDLFDYGVSLQQFITVLGWYDNIPWFTDPNTIQQVNYWQGGQPHPGYVDIYD